MALLSPLWLVGHEDHIRGRPPVRAGNVASVGWKTAKQPGTAGCGSYSAFFIHHSSFYLLHSLWSLGVAQVEPRWSLRVSSGWLLGGYQLATR
jgi:hypothetical protein